jgi:pimeloyl-ACP methyl ester carboxylesterase
LLGCLAHHLPVQHWAYRQTPDEPSGLTIALTLLHDHIKGKSHPIHLVGHGTGGLLGWLYARQYPQRVQSLTLLAVGVNPALDWQAHYYSQLEKLTCDRQQVLAQMAHRLFGYQAPPLVSGWVKLLEQDLTYSPSPHSLLKRQHLCPGSVPVPLLVCGSLDDPIIPPSQIQGWKPWLKAGDQLWQCPQGRHFFHASHPYLVAQQLLEFWRVIKVPVAEAMPQSSSRLRS